MSEKLVDKPLYLPFTKREKPFSPPPFIKGGPRGFVKATSKNVIPAKEAVSQCHSEAIAEES